ncbi:hypothetical protein ALC62_02063 [Cyphomyrmex costatus]|uniref:DDE Tnp4 domain-containing protein n=1 Tax=Cyphomyrmex costatus TaxID=456900 RepID=A0A151INR1_9HYME|nr:hypothetical protein ALC62_02063 [Cyphomyrmex costatus]
MEEYILFKNIMFESSSSSSSSDSDNNDEELQNILFNNNNDKRRVIPKINNYLEHVARYTNIEFKLHFSNSYINRKGRFSIQLQVICKDDLSFIHVFAGMPGCVHDMRVFLYSGVQQYCTPEYFPEDSHLLGDAANSIQKNVMVPFNDNGHLTKKQKEFNHYLSSARITVERAIALLKGRWRYLLDKLPMTRTDLIPYYIVSCVLHNICLLNYGTIEIPIVIPDTLHIMEPLAITNELKEEENIKRNRLMEIITNDNF